MFTGTQLICVEWGLIIPMSMMFVAARFFIRIRYMHNVSWLTDGLVLFSHLLQIANSCFDAFLWKRGFFNGTNSTTDIIDPASNVVALKAAYASPVIYYVGLWAIKAALVSIYFHLIPITEQKHRLAMQLLTIYVGITFVIVCLINTLWCQPISRNWSLDPALNCWSYSIPDVNIISAVLHLSTDMWIFIIPFPLLRHLDMSRTQKFAIGATFGIGSISIIATIFRLAIVWTTASVNQVAVWSCVELAAGVIVICFPGLRKLLQIWGIMKERSQYGSGSDGRRRSDLPPWYSRNGTTDNRESYQSQGTGHAVDLNRFSTGKATRLGVAERGSPGAYSDRIDEDGSEEFIIHQTAPLPVEMEPAELGTTTRITADMVYAEERKKRRPKHSKE